VATSPEEAFRPIREIGGTTGWYYADWVWRLRGWIDRRIGGVGMGHGRRDPIDLHVGDTIDSWRVVCYEMFRLLLKSEMRLPGQAWLEFEVAKTESGSLIRQVSTFEPSGWLGWLYWYIVYPFHVVLFSGMLNAIARAATRRRGSDNAAT
jgi:hypothetical protein